MKKRKIAIIGAGFSGLATAYYLTEASCEVTLYDSGELGQNASGISGGLLHTFSGARSKKTSMGDKGLEETLKLVAAAEKQLGFPIAKKTGLLRLAVSPEQKEYYRMCASQYSAEVSWRSPEECGELLPGIAYEPGIFIHEAYILNTKHYLEGLWKHCQSAGAVRVRKTINSLKELDHYQVIIAAAGAYITALPELSDLPIKQIKGQILEIDKKSLPPLAVPVNSAAYLLQGGNSGALIAGATFERNFIDEGPDIKAAIDYLCPKIVELFPGFQMADITNCRSGLRASAPQHKPLVKRISEKSWAITGMGSKGLLYHALYSRLLADEVINFSR